MSCQASSSAAAVVIEQPDKMVQCFSFRIFVVAQLFSALFPFLIHMAGPEGSRELTNEQRQAVYNDFLAQSVNMVLPRAAILKSARNCNSGDRTVSRI